LRHNTFDREGAVSGVLPVVPYIPALVDGFSYDIRDSKRHGHGHPYSSGYGGSQLAGSSAYGAYESYSLGWDGTVWLPSQNNISRMRNHAY
ncbi:hypothetical protein L195_g040411, partial [Trifolium pratense]